MPVTAVPPKSIGMRSGCLWFKLAINRSELFIASVVLGILLLLCLRSGLDGLASWRRGESHLRPSSRVFSDNTFLFGKAHAICEFILEIGVAGQGHMLNRWQHRFLRGQQQHLGTAQSRVAG